MGPRSGYQNYVNGALLIEVLILSLSLFKKMAFERKEMKVDMKKTEAMVCKLEGEAPKNKIDLSVYAMEG